MAGPDIPQVNTADTYLPFTWASVLPGLGEAAGILDVSALCGSAGGELAYRLSPILNGSHAVLRQGEAVIGGTVLGLAAGVIIVGSLVLENMGQQVQTQQLRDILT